MDPRDAIAATLMQRFAVQPTAAPGLERGLQRRAADIRNDAEQQRINQMPDPATVWQNSLNDQSRVGRDILRFFGGR